MYKTSLTRNKVWEKRFSIHTKEDSAIVQQKSAGRKNHWKLESFHPGHYNFEIFSTRFLKFSRIACESETMSDSKISLTYSIKNEKSLSPTLKVRNHTVSEHLPADNREALYPNRSSDRITDKSKNNRSIEFSVDLINSHGIVGKTKKRAKKLTPLKHGFTRIHHRNQISLGLHHSDFVKNSKTVSKKSLWKNIYFHASIFFTLSVGS